MTSASPPTLLDHAGIAARVPHAGPMCLLGALHAFSAQHIHCSSRAHDDPAHPLRSPGGLLAPAAIEYAAQAMALHGGLLAEQASDQDGADTATPRAGFLASARQVVMHQPRLDTAAGPLQVHAQRLAGDGGQAMYQFSVRDVHDQLLVEGRATVVLDASGFNFPSPTPA